ncbi:MAG: hypothetical protein K9L17_03510 [Clostridiales bacterium]|nr:hypothetical protein [Clostridiales bacterium]MCF8021747.1 hypothetical protein [Clostridiales bacterium]
MNNYSEEYLWQKLEWTKQRMEALEQIEIKLHHMKELTSYARDNELSQAKKQEVNDRLHELQDEINELDEKTRVPWVDNQ